jgi:hypothetical protein
MLPDSGNAEAKLEGFSPAGHHCHEAAGNGHKAVKALLDSGKVEAGSEISTA